MNKRTKPEPSPRVQTRPDPESWGPDELMTLQEAVELHWPKGPITVPTLRTAIRDGQLAVCPIAGKFFLTRRLLTGLSTGRVLADPSIDKKSRGRRGGGLSEEEARAVAGLPRRQ